MANNKSLYLSNTHLAEMIEISEGRVANTFNVDKFGYNSAVGSSYETVWDGNNLYTYIATAGTAVVTSSNTSDDNGGTVLIEGLDANYNIVNETLTIGGSAGSVQFFRVFRALMITANTGSTNSGNVTVTVDSKSAAIITAGEGQTLMALYTIPAKHTGYLTQLDVGSSKDVENTIRVTMCHGNTVRNTKAFLSKRGGFSEKNFKIPLRIPEKHDIEVQCKASATSAISAGFELILVKK